MANKLGAIDCPKQFQSYFDAIGKLESMNGIKTTTVQDFITIWEKFPCNEFICSVLINFVSIFFWNLNGINVNFPSYLGRNKCKNPG